MAIGRSISWFLSQDRRGLELSAFHAEETFVNGISWPRRCSGPEGREPLILSRLLASDDVVAVIVGGDPGTPRRSHQEMDTPGLARFLANV